MTNRAAPVPDVPPEFRSPGDGWLRPHRLDNGPEMLEAPDACPDLLVGSLADLDRINAFPGGHAMTVRGLASLLAESPEGGPGAPGKGSQLSVLDLACGGASLAREVCRWASERGVLARVTATDFREGILGVARSCTPEDLPVDFVLADARSLPFADRSFDVVSLSLALHHFEPAVAADVLREMLRVSRTGIVVSDLVRSWVGAAGSLTLIRALSKNPMTRADGAASARKAYTRQEMRRLAVAAGANEARLRFRGVPGYRTVMTAAR